MSSAAIVHVVDDDDALRDSLSFLLSSAGIESKTYDSAGSFLASAPPDVAGCVLTDVRMPGMSGVDLLRELKSRSADLPVIVMTGHGDVPLAVEAMKLGAADFIEKPFNDDILIASVRNALNFAQRDVQQSAERALIQSRLEMLSARERQVLEGLVAGNPNKIIAFDLGISPRTVEIYRANVMTKMEAGSLSELVRMALNVKILSSTPHP
ncbi:MAG: response regulator FixJ [Xanthobacteraceae bacterium]